ncbi:MAG: hypothetical protein H7A37_01365 [Chlamydiales bacterium]|nr:hypothetical protein [Chlamydiia bacterium]MCP5506943.1 hypothetical protein [Chlamydiales bacterium]
MDNKNQPLEKKIAQLEFEQDQLITELSYVDQLLRSVGFPQGLESVKETAKEMLNEQQ